MAYIITPWGGEGGLLKIQYISESYCKPMWLETDRFGIKKQDFLRSSPGDSY